MPAELLLLPMIALLLVGFLALAALLWFLAHAVDGYEDASGFHEIGAGDAGLESCRAAPLARRSVSSGRRSPKSVKPRPLASPFFRSRAGR